MKGILYKLLFIFLALGLIYFLFTYFVTYSEGVRSGDLIKFSRKGVIFKTWEGKLSQGVSEELQFNFSVEKDDKEVIKDLQNLQGTFVKLTYIERYRTFFWLGDTKYFIKKSKKDNDQHDKKSRLIAAFFIIYSNTFYALNRDHKTRHLLSCR